MVDATFTFSAFAMLFVVIDPIGMAPLFVALTLGMDSAHRRSVALRACGIGILVLAVFGLAGEAVLNFVGISMPAFRIAGGILLFLTALDMLFERRTKRRSGHASNSEDPSVFPLATPLIAGPGAITTMILLRGEAGNDPVAVVSVFVVMVVVVALTLLLFLAAGPIERAMGQVGVTVITRLLGMLLAALSVQFVLDGLSAVGVLSG